MISHFWPSPSRANPTKLPRIGSKFTVPRPRKPFQITVTNVTAKSVIGKDSRGKKWTVPLSWLNRDKSAPKKQKHRRSSAAAMCSGRTGEECTHSHHRGRPSRRWSKKVASFKIGYTEYFVKKAPGGYKGFVIDEEEYGPYETEVTGVQKSVAAVKKAVVKNEKARKKAEAKAARDSAALPPEKRWGYTPPYAGPPGPAVEWPR